MVESLTIRQCSDLRMATVMSRKGADATSLGERLGLTLPPGPGVARAGALTLVATGPGVWLAVAEAAGPEWVETLGERLAGLASVSDQSAGYVVFRFSGAGSRDLLQKGAFVDLHEPVFGQDGAAVTVIAHMGVILWQADQAPSFDCAVFRSFADDFRHWIDVARQSFPTSVTVQGA